MFWIMTKFWSLIFLCKSYFISPPLNVLYFFWHLYGQKKSFLLPNFFVNKKTVDKNFSSRVIMSIFFDYHQILLILEKKRMIAKLWLKVIVFCISFFLLWFFIFIAKKAFFTRDTFFNDLQKSNSAKRIFLSKNNNLIEWILFFYFFFEFIFILINLIKDGFIRKVKWKMFLFLW